VVFGLGAVLNDTNRSMGIPAGLRDDFEKFRLTDVIGAGTGDKRPSGTQHLERAQVQFLVAAQGGIEVLPAFGEGGRVQDDGVVLPLSGRVVAEQIEGVGLNPFNLASIEPPDAGRIRPGSRRRPKLRLARTGRQRHSSPAGRGRPRSSGPRARSGGSGRRS
jgi:hypothetical protein